MGQNTKQQIRKNVFAFYAEHQQECNESYTLAEDENIDEIYEYINDDSNKNTLFVKTSIIILTANKYERNILHKRISQVTSGKIKKFEIELTTACKRYNKLYAYWFDWNGYSVLHIHANVTGSYTIGGSADIIRWILSNKYLFPVTIISFGICFGTDLENCELGDVIISKKIYPYFIGAKIKGKDLSVVDDNAFGINSDLHNKITDLENNNKFKNFSFKTALKNYITGEAVVSSKNIRDKFTHITTQEICAGDMEGYGLFKECKSGKIDIPCIVLKSICDWGAEKNFNEKNIEILSEFKEAVKCFLPIEENEQGILKTLKERLQAYSANCAFNVLEVMINNNIFEISILGRAKQWLRTFKGVATFCNFLKKEICKCVYDAKLGDTVSDSFVHKCVEILESEGLVHRDSTCLSQDGNKDNCIYRETASIDIRK